jgi:hypothetical protein
LPFAAPVAPPIVLALPLGVEQGGWSAKHQAGELRWPLKIKKG